MRFQTLYEGRYIFAVVFALLAVGLVLHWMWLVALSALLVIFCVNFFRDPNRAIPPGNGSTPATRGSAADSSLLEGTRC